MKYITLELDLRDGKLEFQPMYCPAVSLGETVYIRVITGNFRPDSLFVMFKGNMNSKYISMNETYPTVFETRLKPQYVKDTYTDTISRFKMKFHARYKNKEYEIETDEIMQILGCSLGRDSLTDLSEIYNRINSLSDKLNEI